MSGLVISLKPNERFLVNGALLSNGAKRSQLCIEGEDVYVLRLSDAIHPESVDTPIKRVYYLVQLILSGDVSPSDVAQRLDSGLQALGNVFANTPLSESLSKAHASAEAGRYYSTLYALKSLFELEAKMLDVRPAKAVPNVALAS
jgi:flagellar protein FlbT